MIFDGEGVGGAGGKLLFYHFIQLFSALNEHDSISKINERCAYKGARETRHGK